MKYHQLNGWTTKPKSDVNDSELAEPVGGNVLTPNANVTAFLTFQTDFRIIQATNGKLPSYMQICLMVCMPNGKLPTNAQKYDCFSS